MRISVSTESREDHQTAELSQQNKIEHEEDQPLRRPDRLWTVLGRAGLVYLGLFVGLSAIMVLLGVDPLIHNSALPKFLLVYIGLAVIPALVNRETNVVDELARSWLALAKGRPFRKR
jgi:hypothetical protein